MPRNRRPGIEIDFEILKALRDEERSVAGEPRLTRLQARAYVSWGALQAHLTDLRERGLIDADQLRVTQLGNEFVRFYASELRTALQRFGFITDSSL